MTITAVDPFEWLDKVGDDPDFTLIDKTASFSFAGGEVAGVTSEQLEESFNKFVRRGYIATKLFLDDQAELRYQLRIPKADR